MEVREPAPLGQSLPFEGIEGSPTMIDCPLVQELFAKRMHKAIGNVLTGRFGSVPPEITTALCEVKDDDALEDLMVWAVQCPTLEAFASQLPSYVC